MENKNIVTTLLNGSQVRTWWRDQLALYETLMVDKQGHEIGESDYDVKWEAAKARHGRRVESGESNAKNQTPPPRA